MTPNESTALLMLLADLRIQIAEQQAELQRRGQRIAELEHLASEPANPFRDDE